MQLGVRDIPSTPSLYALLHAEPTPRDDDDEFDSEFDECEEDEAILKAMLLAQEYYLLYGDEGNITSCAKVEHDLMFR